jgi:hypothetical protein
MAGSMIGVGSVEYGPEIARLPIAVAVDRVGRLLADSGPPNGVDVELAFVFVIPGSLGGAPFSGAQISRVQPGRVQVLIAVPTSVAGLADPTESLLLLVRATVDQVAAEGVEPEPLVQAINASIAGAAMLQPITEVMGRREPDDIDAILDDAYRATGIHREPNLPRPNREIPASELVHVYVTLGDGLDALAVLDLLEERIDASLKPGLGAIEGNEIGQSSVSVFIESPHPESATRAVLQGLEGSGFGSGSYVESNGVRHPFS